MIGVAVLGYVGYALWTGWQATARELAGYAWWTYLGVLGLTLVNYGLRYLKWAWLLRRLGIEVPPRENALAFLAGLGMVISPGKAGELVKPWIVREITGAPMARTIPALVTERLTDGIAVVLLAAVGVGTYAPEHLGLVWVTLGLVGAGVLAVAYEPLARAVFAAVRAVGPLAKLAGSLEDLYASLRVCLGPRQLLVTLAVSLVAWFAECIGYWWVLLGLGIDADLGVATFLYAFATVFGAPSPGGMGLADAFLAEGAVRLIPGVTSPQAFAAAVLIRVATLWFGVLVGAVVLTRLDRVARRADAP
jgi:uncharacterized membrane protein YbhN (UPF0104 family)